MGNFQDYFELSQNSSELNNNRDLTNTFNIDPTQGNYTGIHMYDINDDGLIDLIPQTGWNINFQDTPGLEPNINYLIFMNNGEKFFPTKVISTVIIGQWTIFLIMGICKGLKSHMT